MNLIDTHCHLSFANFDRNRAAVLEHAAAAGVTKVISIGCSVLEAEKSIALAQQHREVFAAVGLHPADLGENWKEDFAKIANLASAREVVAIGETGLDFFRPENAPREHQILSFEKHIALARTVQKPLVIHMRAAVADTLAILKKADNVPFVLHCFSENESIAAEILALGGMISFTGIVTFPKNTEVQAVAKNIPLEKIMVETDAPFLAPVPQRGKENEPAYVRYTAEYIAALRGISFAEFAEATTRNVAQFFGI